MEPPGADPGTGLEESMWRLGLAAGEGLPERPGQPPCVYYLRTGSCGYGDKCRFNHPRDRAAVIAAERAEGEYPERHDQPLCQYFLKTGTCKFGAACKYHHPKHGGPVALNYHNYPLRPGEKECSYYMKSGHCKFGVTCKFHHPQPAGFPMPPAAPAFYSPMQQPPPSPPSYPVVAGWQAGRPPLLPGSYMQGAYGPVVFPQGFVPVSGWSAYPPPVNSAVSLGEQNLAQAASMYGGLPQQLSASAPAYLSPYRLVSPSHGPSSSSQKEHNFPERPGQPECQFYMRTGDCKFGPTCRYHHPPQWSMPKTSCALSPIGLPLRPDAPPCTFYMQHGVCKFGPTCKFDHPMGMLGYSTSAFPLVDMPALQYPMDFSAATLAPSSSSSDLRPEFFTTTNMDSLPIQAQLSGTSSSSSVSSVFTASRSASQSFGSAFGQNLTSLSSSSSLGHGGEISGSS